MADTGKHQLKTAIWARVSTRDQHTENQLAELRAWAEQMGLNVVTMYVTEDSAWAESASGNGKGKEFEAKRTELLHGVRQGKHPVVLVWAIDRFSRRGSEDMQRYLRLLAEAGADVRSKHDPWLNTADPMAREMLVGVFATLAKYESQRRSDRIRAGLARRKAEELPVGRQPGATDKGPRRRSGYVASWENGGARRAAQKVLGEERS
jgi:DNA invertase Pin-like site-specific DNA recombinase